MPRARHNPEKHTYKEPKGVLTPEEREKRGSKRTDAQREVDKLSIMRMIKRGMTQAEIAEEIGVHRTQVTYDLRIIFGELAEHRHKITEEIVAARELQYSELLKEAWNAWDRSKEPAVTEVDESTDTKGGHKDKTQRTTKYQVGDPKFLQIIAQCYDKLNQIQGLYPTREMSIKGTVTTTEATVNWDVLAGITDGRVPDEVEEQIRKVVEALPDNTGQGRPRKDIGPQEESKGTKG